MWSRLKHPSSVTSQEVLFLVLELYANVWQYVIHYDEHLHIHLKHTLTLYRDLQSTIHFALLGSLSLLRSSASTGWRSLRSHRRLGRRTGLEEQSLSEP